MESKKLSKGEFDQKAFYANKKTDVCHSSARPAFHQTEWEVGHSLHLLFCEGGSQCTMFSAGVYYDFKKLTVNRENILINF